MGVGMTKHDWKTWTYNQIAIDNHFYKDQRTYCDVCKMEIPFDITWPEYLEIWKSPCIGRPSPPSGSHDDSIGVSPPSVPGGPPTND